MATKLVKTVSVNTWVPARAGLFGKPFITFTIAGKEKVVKENRIAPLSRYFYQYAYSMRSPIPTLMIKGESEYKSDWLSLCITELHTRDVYGNTDIDETADHALQLYETYGAKGIDPTTACNENLGTRESLWKKRLIDRLAPRQDSEEYQRIAAHTKLGLEDHVNLMWKKYPDLDPDDAMEEFFGLADKLANSKLSENVTITLALPKIISDKFGPSQIKIETSKPASYRGKGVICIDYSRQDEGKEIYKLLTYWLGIAKNRELPVSVYAAAGELEGNNAVLGFADSRPIENAYPVSVTTSTLELHIS